MLKSLILVLALITGAPALAQRITPTTDLTVARIEIIWADGRNDLDRMRREKYAELGFPVLNNDKLEAFTLTATDGTCFIYAVRPRNVNDRATLMLGHELLHCLNGDYHTESAARR